MATTVTYDGSLSIEDQFRALFTVEFEGSEVAKVASRSTLTTIAGFFKGAFTVAAGDFLLAHASDPLQGMGDAAYTLNFTVASKKLAYLYLKNTHASISWSFARGAANGLTLFDAASDAITLKAGAEFRMADFTNGITSALTTGSNDKLTITPASGSPTGTIVAVYIA